MTTRPSSRRRTTTTTTLFSFSFISSPSPSCEHQKWGSCLRVLTTHSFPIHPAHVLSLQPFHIFPMPIQSDLNLHCLKKLDTWVLSRQNPDVQQPQFNSLRQVLSFTLTNLSCQTVHESMHSGPIIAVCNFDHPEYQHRPTTAVVSQDTKSHMSKASNPYLQRDNAAQLNGHG